MGIRTDPTRRHADPPRRISMTRSLAGGLPDEALPRQALLQRLKHLPASLRKKSF